AEHDERELAPLREKGGEEPAVTRSYAELCGERGERSPLQQGEDDDQRRDCERSVGDETKVNRHADRDEEKAHEQALEGLDVRLERMAVLRPREKDTREERAERHRDA